VKNDITNRGTNSYRLLCSSDGTNFDVVSVDLKCVHQQQAIAKDLPHLQLCFNCHRNERTSEVAHDVYAVDRTIVEGVDAKMDTSCEFGEALNESLLKKTDKPSIEIHHSHPSIRVIYGQKAFSRNQLAFFVSF